MPCGTGVSFRSWNLLVSELLNGWVAFRIVQDIFLDGSFLHFLLLLLFTAIQM